MKRKLVFTVTILLIATVLLTLFFTHALDGTTQTPPSSRQFFVGVEYAYGFNNQSAQLQLAQLEALVDKVKDYTNLLVIGSLGITFNQTVLTQACDYIYNANLSIIVLFTGLDLYQVPKAPPVLAYDITTWMVQAQERYGDKFLGVYRYDEPGGRTLDQGIDPLVYKANYSTTATYGEVANDYINHLKVFPNYYLQFSPRVVTADFGLYWFDYASNYSSIFAEFVGNESRDRHIALCRGAADAFGKDWGTIITWKYDSAPYIESPDELYSDLALSYSAGANYTILFSYPQTNYTQYGILTQAHFDALKRFWTNLHTNPELLGSNLPQVVYIVPADYGFGFRNPKDSIWGVFPADALSSKIFNDTNTILPAKYGAGFDILYDQTPLTWELLQCYNDVYYWNQTIT